MSDQPTTAAPPAPPPLPPAESSSMQAGFNEDVDTQQQPGDPAPQPQDQPQQPEHVADAMANAAGGRDQLNQLLNDARGWLDPEQRQAFNQALADPARAEQAVQQLAAHRDQIAEANQPAALGDEDLDAAINRSPAAAHYATQPQFEQQYPQILQRAGVDEKDLVETWLKNGDLSDDQYRRLEAATKAPRASIRSAIAARQKAAGRVAPSSTAQRAQQAQPIANQQELWKVNNAAARGDKNAQARLLRFMKNNRRFG